MKTKLQVAPIDLRAAIVHACEYMQQLDAGQWSGKCQDLTWSRIECAGHILDAFSYCIVNQSNPATQPLPRVLRVSQGVASNDIVSVLPLWGEVFIQATEVAAKSGSRGAHRWGYPDSEGYLAIGCVEVLLHTYDMLRDTDLKNDFEQSLESTTIDKVTVRLFPWTTGETNFWKALLWATGRLQITGKPDMRNRWAWHCDLLSEWNGELKFNAQ